MSENLIFSFIKTSSETENIVYNMMTVAMLILRVFQIFAELNIKAQLNI